MLIKNCQDYVEETHETKMGSAGSALSMQTNIRPCVPLIKRCALTYAWSVLLPLLHAGAVCVASCCWPPFFFSQRDERICVIAAAASVFLLSRSFSRPRGFKIYFWLSGTTGLDCMGLGGPPCETGGRSTIKIACVCFITAKSNAKSHFFLFSLLRILFGMLLSVNQPLVF